MNPFMNLPDEVVRFELFQYLDYEGRNALNECLPFEARVGTPLQKDTCIQLVMTLQAALTRRLLNNIETVHTPIQRSRKIINMYKSVDRMSYLIQYNKNFRNMFISKCKSYVETDHEDYRVAPKYFKKNIINVCSSFLDKCDAKYPYKYDVRVISKNDEWTPIRRRYVAKEFWKSK